MVSSPLTPKALRLADRGESATVVPPTYAALAATSCMPMYEGASLCTCIDNVCNVLLWQLGGFCLYDTVPPL